MVLFEDSEVTSSNASDKSVADKKGPAMVFTRKTSDVSDKVMMAKALRTRIKLDRLTVFMQQLASMLQAGLPLSHALDTIVAEIDDKIFKFILIQIKEGIFAGSSFTDSLKQFPNAFPPLVYNMVEAGEVSGSLPDAMETIANYLDASLKLAKKFKSALTYPVVIVVFSFLLVFSDERH